MKRNCLGSTGIDVSEICYGTLTLGPLQKNLDVKEGRDLLLYAYDQGINFFDSADLYNTYSYLHGLIQKHPEAIICTRSYDYSKDGVMHSLHRALKEIGRDYIDIYLLHEQESKYTFEGHWEAVEALIQAKKQGVIRALGFSTHRVEAVRDSLDYNDFEVVFPLINYTGIGIEDGTAEEMLQAIQKAKEGGKGILAMKILGGGTLISTRKTAFSFAKQLLKEQFVDSIALGMQTLSEIDYNVRYFTSQSISKKLRDEVDSLPRRLLIDDWCEGCGSCVKRCHQHALSLKDNKAHVDPKKCLTCGYCASVCPVFALKVI